MLSFVNWITFLWLAYLALYSGRRIARGFRHSVDCLTLVHFIFCALPLFFDEVFGKPPYTHFIGFIHATSDLQTNLIYCAYISVVPVLWLLFGVNKHIVPVTVPPLCQRDALAIPSRQKNLIIVAHLFLFLPFALAFVSPERGQYLLFSRTLRASLGDSGFHAQLSLACYVACIAWATLIVNAKPHIYGKGPALSFWLFTVPFVFISIWLHGKRNIVALAAILALLGLQHRGVLRGKRAYQLGMITMLVVLGYSFFFQSYTGRVTRTLYENMRVDYGRDDVIKMTIFAEMHPDEMQILEHRGQSFLFHLTTLVPRDFWPDKPLPYAQYLTSALFYSAPRFWGWSMTTSILEEFIANTGWIGMLLAPIFLAIFCRIGDASGGSLLRILTPMIACLLLAVQLTAYYPLMLLWGGLVLADKFRYSKNTTHIRHGRPIRP